MSTSVDIAFVHQYDSNFQLLAQQESERIRKAVRVKETNGKTANFERIGSVTMAARTSRHQDTNLVNTPHSRRRATLVDYEVGDLIDDEDEIRLLIDPDSAYTMAFAAAAARRMDQTSIDAAVGNATSVAADDTTSTVALPSAQKVAAASTGLTLAKLRQANTILDANEFSKGSGMRWLVYNAEGLEDILGDSTATSADYNSVRLLMNASITSFHGFEWIHSELLGTDGTDRQHIAWHRRAMGLALGKAPFTEMSRRSDKSNSLQVLTKETVGAVRIEDEGVVEIAVVE